MQIAINSLLKTLKIRARNKNIIIEFKYVVDAIVIVLIVYSSTIVKGYAIDN